MNLCYVQCKQLGSVQLSDKPETNYSIMIPEDIRRWAHLKTCILSLKISASIVKSIVKLSYRKVL